MKAIKFSSFILFSILFMFVFMPHLSAKRHSSFSLNFNLAPSVSVAPTPYTVAPTPYYVNYVAPQPMYTVVQPYHPAYVQNVYYPAPMQTQMIAVPVPVPVYSRPVKPRPHPAKVQFQSQISFWR